MKLGRRLGLLAHVMVLACGDGEASASDEDEDEDACGREAEAVFRRELAVMSFGRHDHSMTQLAGGEVIVAGGRSCGGELTDLEASVERYSFALQRWDVVAPLPEPRRDHAAVALPDGDLLVFGGVSPGGEPTAVLRYATEDDVWTEIGVLPEPMNRPRAVLLGDGRTVIAGSSYPVVWLRSDDAGATWRATMPGQVGPDLQFNTPLVVLPDEHVLLPGPYGRSYASATDEWVDGPAVPGVGKVDGSEYLFVDTVALEEQADLGTVQLEPTAWLWDPLLDRRTDIGFAPCPPSGDESTELVKGVYANGVDTVVVEGIQSLALWRRAKGWGWISAPTPLPGRGAMLEDGTFMLTGGDQVGTCTSTTVWPP